ncbi:hypothetical protein DL96DRAFT_1811307 [Flagelloscypha sp. PMI_526]|nr:hypothetical protein DL96DRAFT_1811307 [Flagelloscypha sp. PMI_526]
MLSSSHIQSLLNSTVRYFTFQSPHSEEFSDTQALLSDGSDSELTEDGYQTPSSADEGDPLQPGEVQDPIARLNYQSTSLRPLLGAAPFCCCIGSRSRPSHTGAVWRSYRPLIPENAPSDPMSDVNHHHPSHREYARLEDKCRRLERALKETREALRNTEAELERARRSDYSRSGTSTPRRRSEDGPPSRPTSPFKSRANSYHRHSLIARSSGEILVPADLISEERARRKSAEVFFTKTDTWSGKDVLQAVQDLNSEILQLSATVTEAYSFSSAHVSVDDVTDAARSTGSRLGHGLTTLLVRREHQDPMLVQLALQGCVTLVVARALSSFCLGLPSRPDTMLTQLHSHMHMAEPQPVASRWRSLTHQHIRALHPDMDEIATDEMTETILRWAADVLVISGCPDSHTLKSRFASQLKRITWSVARLTKVLREEIMSTNFDIFAIEGGQGFEHNLMKDAFGEYSRTSGSVLTTTELGVRCLTRMPDGSPERRVLLLPKVVVESVVDVLN